jgi:hypothetical protein
MADLLDDEQLPPWLGEDSEASPTIGMRMAGRVPPPAPAPAAPPPMPAVPFDPSKIPSSIRPQPISPSSVPVPPTGANNPNLIDLAKQQAQYGKPIDKNAVGPDGKPLYKMGTGTRVLGTISNALQGFGRKPFTPIYTGPGATNARFERDEAQREGNLQNVNTQIGTQEKLDSEQEKMYRDAIKQAYEGQLGESRNKIADATQSRADTASQLADTKQQLSTSQEALNQAKAAQATSTANQKDATRPRAVMGTRTYEKQDDGTWKDVGAAPTKQFNPNAGGRGSKTEFDKIERDKQNQLKQAELKARQAVTKLKPFDMADTRPLAARRQDIYDQLEQDKAQAQADYEARISEKGGDVNSPAAQRTVNAPPPNKVVQPASKIDPKNLPKTVMVNGKERKVVGYNQTTKKVQVAPEGQ